MHARITLIQSNKRLKVPKQTVIPVHSLLNSIVY